MNKRQLEERAAEAIAFFKDDADMSELSTVCDEVQTKGGILQ